MDLLGRHVERAAVPAKRLARVDAEAEQGEPVIVEAAMHAAGDVAQILACLLSDERDADAAGQRSKAQMLPSRLLREAANRPVKKPGSPGAGALTPVDGAVTGGAGVLCARTLLGRRRASIGSAPASGLRPPVLKLKLLRKARRVPMVTAIRISPAARGPSVLLLRSILI